MRIYFGKASMRANVPAKVPIEASAAEALEIFHSLDPKGGWLGIFMDSIFIVHLFPYRDGRVRIELLDSSKPAFDWCFIDVAFAEELIRSAGNHDDIFTIARKKIPRWEHMDLPKPELNDS